MIRKLTQTGAIALCVIAAGCGVQGENYHPRTVPASKSVVYIYRPYMMIGSETDPTITCGHETVELQAGGYDDFIEDPGTISCAAANDPKTAYTFETRAGGQYYVKVDVGVEKMAGTPHFKLMSADVGGDEIRECARQGVEK